MLAANRSDEFPMSSALAPQDPYSLRSSARREVYLAFTDFVSFTEMTLRCGDLEAHRLMQRHNRLIREELAANGGEEVEVLGDGFLLAFPNPLAALRCAVGIQSSCVAYRATRGGEPIRVRIGVHSGKVLQANRGFFGRDVILCSRLAAAARPDEILVSSAVCEAAARAPDLWFGPARLLELKGFAQKQAGYPVERLRRRRAH